MILHFLNSNLTESMYLSGRTCLGECSLVSRLHGNGNQAGERGTLYWRLVVSYYKCRFRNLHTRNCSNGPQTYMCVHVVALCTCTVSYLELGYSHVNGV